MDAQAMNYQNWTYICEITGKTKIKKQTKVGKANKPLKQENKSCIQVKKQKNKVPNISAPKIFPVHPLPLTPLEMR